MYNVILSLYPQFATEGYTILAAMKLCDLDNMMAKPNTLPDGIKDQLQWLQSIAYMIVDMCYVPPDNNDLKKAVMVYTDCRNNPQITETTEAICRGEWGT